MSVEIRHDWNAEEVQSLYDLPLNDLLYQAHQVHRAHFDPNEVQVSTLLSVKTGGCPENCSYCPQSAHYDTGLEREKFMAVEEVVAAAKKAKEHGATRFCMGGAWRSPPKKDFPRLVEMIKAVKACGMETCLTAGMLEDEQVGELEESGLDYYNHNLDTSAEYYEKITSTRGYQDRLDTLKRVRESKLKVCCGGIVGMGEDTPDRIGLLLELANLPEHPESVPINLLVRVPGTPLENQEGVDPIEFVRLIALARIMMPLSRVRLSAGRREMADTLQAMCFFAGANSIHYGEKLLTTPTPDTSDDDSLFQRLGLKGLAPAAAEASEAECTA